jgi:two-component system NarL family sensor kinase
MNVASPDWRELSPDDLRLLYTVGDLLSIAIERARLFERSVQFGAIEERNRLAREIHDTLAQGLAAIALQLETADALLEAGTRPDTAHQTVQQALALTRKNLDEARRSVMDLRAAPLEGRSLGDALTALAEEWAGKNDLSLKLRLTGESHPLPMRIESGLYRIAQEALTNVVRHAQAQELSVELVVTPDRARLVIGDDGRGFDVDHIPKGRYGLIGMNERARLLGGQLEVQSCPGEGTCIEVVVSLEDEA